VPSRSAEEWYELACCHATLAGAAARERSGISASDGEAEAGKAIDLLRLAVAEGYRNADAMAKEIALDPLRGRPDFRLLMMDLVFLPSRWHREMAPTGRVTDPADERGRRSTRLFEGVLFARASLLPPCFLRNQPE